MHCHTEEKYISNKEFKWKGPIERKTGIDGKVQISRREKCVTGAWLHYETLLTQVETLHTGFSVKVWNHTS